MGESPSAELINKIEEIIKKLYKADLFPHHYHIHNYVSQKELSFHIRLDGNLSIRNGQSIATKIEKKILKKRKRVTNICHRNNKKKRKVCYSETVTTDKYVKSVYIQDMNIDLYYRMLLAKNLQKDEDIINRLQCFCEVALSGYNKKAFKLELKKSDFVFLLETPYDSFFKKKKHSQPYFNKCVGRYVIPIIFAFVKIC